MLSTMRSGANSVLIKVVLFGLLLFAMLGLAILDVQGMLRQSVGSGTVAKISGQKITAPEFDRLYQRTLRQQNVNAEDAQKNGMPGMVLNQELNTRMYALAARDAGLIVDDKTAAADLRKQLLTPIAKEAGVSEKEAFARFLKSIGMSEDAFVASYKAQLASDALIKIIAAPARAPQQLITDALKRRYEWRRGEYFELTAKDLGATLPQPTDDELKKHYETIASDFLLPEYRDFSVLLIDGASLGISDKPTEDEIAKFYADNTDTFAQPEKRKVEQVIAHDEAAAKEIMAEAKAGQSLAALAKKTKPALPYTSSESSENEMDVDVAKAVFAAKQGDVVGPVKTPFGWHVMKVDAVTAPRTRPLSEVHDEIAKQLAAEKSGDALYKRATEMDDAVASGKTLEEVAEDNKLKLQKFTGITSEGTTKDGKPVATKLPAFAKIVETAFSLDEGSASQLTETSDGNFLLIETNAVTKAQEQPFDAVRAEVADSYRTKKLGELFDAKTAAITEKLQLGTSFAEVAKSLGKTVSSTSLMQRATEPAKAGVERGVLPALFSLDKVGQTTAVSGDEKVTILRLAERKIDQPKDTDKKDVAALQSTLDRAVRNDVLEQYRAHLLDEYNVTINDELLARMYAPKTDDQGDAPAGEE